MPLRLTIDRFEGGAKGLAVLLTDDGEAINVPRKLLPKGAKAGDVLRASFERDEEATLALADETRRVQDELKGTDPGGDISL